MFTQIKPSPDIHGSSGILAHWCNISVNIGIISLRESAVLFLAEFFLQGIVHRSLSLLVSCYTFLVDRACTNGSCGSGWYVADVAS